MLIFQGAREDKLMIMLKGHRRGFRYSMSEIKGISPFIYTQSIPIEKGAKAVIESQRRLNPNTKDLVRKGGNTST